jgi:colanic acid biosynthesis glycosyl transferase WcaI
MLTDLAEDISRQGWDVTVLVARTAYSGGRGELPVEEWHNGVRIIRIRTTRFGRARILGRLADYLSFMAGAFVRLLRMPRHHVVVAMSDPPFLLAPVLGAGTVRGFRTVYWAQDLYPQLAAKLGLLRERSAPYRLLSSFARRLHARCDLVVALGPRMLQELIAAGSPPPRTIVIENWADAEAITPVPKQENEFVASHGLEDKFVVLYSGNAGRAHTFESVLVAARQLRAEPDVVFLFIGGGSQLGELQQVVERERLTNVRFLEYLPRDQLRYSLSAASVSLVTENPEVTGLIVPSGTYGILASGRPILFVGNAESDVATIVRDFDCGIVVAPADSAGLVHAIRSLLNDPFEVARLGDNARRAVDLAYNRVSSVRRWVSTMTGLVDPVAPPSSRQS